MPREEDPAGTWPQNVNHDALAAVGEDDFTKFLDLENDFDDFQTQFTDNNGHTALETPMGRLAFGQSAIQDMSRQGRTMLQHMNMSINAEDFAGTDSAEEQQQFPQFQMYQQMNPNQHFQVPPTPVSAEMHAAKYMSQVENAGQLIFDRNQASFTPLVSPAQTPLDNAWMPDYVVSDDFFSPLTSPAIEAQPPFSSTNPTTSPVDLNVEPSGASQTPGSSGRRGRRKVQQSQPRTNPRSVKQSPAMKPQTRRRQFSLSSIPLDEIETMLEKSAQSNRLQAGLLRGTTLPSSEDSVSPEPLLELMRPPPVPSNAGKSPASVLIGQSKESDVPATPAMLMRMPGKQSANTCQSSSVAAGHDVMQDITLPDAAAEVPTRILPDMSPTVIIEEDQSTPTITAQTPKLSADNSARSSATKSPNNPSEPNNRNQKLETKLGVRGNKKRQSVSSAAISPALRPKISPSISPLVPLTPSGTQHLAAETNALYLASKSNYQNILDGTHLPGVSYPEALAENLSSKRTSHKIAEQGRRNRINVALKEIEGLLPPAITANIKKEKGAGSSKENEGGSPDKGGSGGSGASKASTVEMAIVYIKSLQAELKDTKDRLEAAEKAIAEGNSSGSQASELETN